MLQSVITQSNIKKYLIFQSHSEAATTLDVAMTKNIAQAGITSKVESHDKMMVEKEINEHMQNVKNHKNQDINKISILFLAADPTDASRLRLGEEFREIQEKLKQSQKRDRFQLQLPQLSTRPSDITQAMLDSLPQIVHFSGHGASTGELCFENQEGQSQLINLEAIAALFEHFSSQVNCVLLNACYSEEQAKSIAKHIQYVIGMTNEIDDESAIAFAMGFYQALGADQSIEDAYKLGCLQIRLRNIPGYQTPILLINGQSAAQDITFPQKNIHTTTTEPSSIEIYYRCDDSALPIYDEFEVHLCETEGLDALCSRMALGLQVKVTVRLLDEKDYNSLKLGNTSWRRVDLLEAVTDKTEQRRSSLETRVNRCIKLIEENCGQAFGDKANIRACLETIGQKDLKNKSGYSTIDIIKRGTNIYFKTQVPNTLLQQIAERIKCHRPIITIHGVDLYDLGSDVVISNVIPSFVFYQEMKPDQLTEFRQLDWIWGEA